MPVLNIFQIIFRQLQYACEDSSSRNVPDINSSTQETVRSCPTNVKVHKERQWWLFIFFILCCFLFSKSSESNCLWEALCKHKNVDEKMHHSKYIINHLIYAAFSNINMYFDF